MQDTITEKAWLSDLLKSILRILKIESKYVDLFKDCSLTATIYFLIGGKQAIVDFPYNFSSVIVMSMAASIIFPMILSGLHLALNNPGMIINAVEGKLTKVSTCLTMLLCLICSPICPILLTNSHEASTEKATRLARKNDPKVLEVANLCRKKKTQLVEFLRIEIGWFILLIIK